MKTEHIANFEELETDIAHFAVIIGSYYTQLLKQKIPQDLAHELTVNFSNLLWGRLFHNKPEGSQ